MRDESQGTRWRNLSRRSSRWEICRGGYVRETRADGIILQVEPQEKKKTPKGRAKKRITYTRRFVNVTLTGGKRKVRIRPLILVALQYLTLYLDEPKPNHIGQLHVGMGW